MFQFFYADSNDTKMWVSLLKLENMFRGNIYQPKLCTLSHLTRGRKPILAMNQQKSSCALNNVFRGIAKMCMMTMNLVYLCTLYTESIRKHLSPHAVRMRTKKTNPAR